MINECNEIATLYKNQSIAEQNSVDISWSLLMEDSYTELRNCIYTNTTELIRFRQLIINCVMATDIIDKNLNKLRKERWIKAFESNNDKTSSTETIEDINRKATIVIEHLIQVRARKKQRSIRFVVV